VRRPQFNWKNLPAFLLAIAAVLILANYVPQLGIFYAEQSDGTKFCQYCRGCKVIQLVKI